MSERTLDEIRAEAEAVLLDIKRRQAVATLNDRLRDFQDAAPEAYNEWKATLTKEKWEAGIAEEIAWNDMLRAERETLTADLADTA